MVASLKDTNPQKYFMNIICDVCFYLGLGNFSNEDRGLTKRQKYLYYIWAVISNTFVFGNILNEYLANVRSDLDAKEKNDLVLFTIAHTTIAAKIIFAFLQKKRIVVVFDKLLDNTTFSFRSKETDEMCVKRCIFICVALAGATYFTLLTSTLDGVWMHITKDIPIRTEVTYYPRNSDTGLLVNILRFVIQFHWWYLVTFMGIIDCICASSLVIVEFKFKVLQVYFKSMRDSVLDNIGKMSREGLEKEYMKQFVVGIQMHENTLRCAKDVQYALGNLYSVQILEAVMLLVMCLVKLVVNERDLIFLMANFAFMVCLVVLTGAYMLVAGDITYEAAQVSTSIFHSGWELVHPGKSLRVLIVVALQRSQEPVFMTAFGILLLSYPTFISVIRSSYSFFAVMY